MYCVGSKGSVHKSQQLGVPWTRQILFRLVNAAEKRLRSEDSDLLKATAGHCTVMYSQKEHLLSPMEICRISRDFLAWGCEGVVGQLVLFPTSGNRAEGRRGLTDVRGSLHEIREVSARIRNG